MHNYDLKPTKENVFMTLSNDKIHRREYINRFIYFLDNIDSSVSVSIDGDWGSGKTFFIKQIVYILLQTNKFIKNISNQENKIEELKQLLGTQTVQDRTLLPVYYNAWKNDNTIDPVLSLVKEIIKLYSCSGKFNGDVNLKNGIKKICKDIISSIDLHIPIGNNTTMIDISGKNLSNIVDSLECFEKHNYLEQIEEQDIIYDKINELFKSLCEEQGDRFIIFVDELDRCKPIFAVNFLERIKHYFDNEYVSFVFSTNIVELQNTIKAVYGNNFDAYTYLDKFFDFKFQLPSVDVKQYLDFINWNISEGYTKQHILFLMEHFSLSMRNINHYLKTYDIVSKAFLGNLDISKNLGIKFCYECIIPILVYLFLFDKERYNNFLLGNEETFFSNLMSCKKSDEYITDFVKLANNYSSSEPKNVGTLKVIYKMIFSKEKYYDFFEKALSKYCFEDDLKRKIEASMSCFF